MAFKYSGLEEASERLSNVGVGMCTYLPIASVSSPSMEDRVNVQLRDGSRW